MPKPPKEKKKRPAHLAAPSLGILVRAGADVHNAHPESAEPRPDAPQPDVLPNTAPCNPAPGAVPRGVSSRYAQLLLLLLPLLIFIINPNWIFQGWGHMDPWYYFGLSIHFPRYQHLAPVYAGERLTWVLPAHLLVSLLTPAYGWMMFHLCVYWASVFSLYTIMRQFAGIGSALVTASMMGCHALFLGANGWTYLDGGSIAYFFLTLAALAAAGRTRNSNVYLLLSGAIWAATAYNYFLWWLLTPCCAFFYWAVDGCSDESSPFWRRDIRRYGIAAAWFALGICVTTLLMVTCHYLIYGAIGRSFYADNLVNALYNLTLKKGTLTWGTQSYGWVLTAGWIVFPVVTFLASAFAVIRHFFFGRRMARLSMGLILAYGYAFLALGYLTLRENQILQFDYYASILIPLEFVVLGVLVFQTPPGISTKVMSCVLAVAILISLAPLRGSIIYNFTVSHNRLWHYLLGLTAMVGAMVWKRATTWSAALIALAVASFGLIPAYPASAWAERLNGLAGMKRVGQAVESIVAATPRNQLPMFWIDNYNDPYTREYRSIMCAILTHMYSMWEYPAIDAQKKYPPGAELILITREKDVFETANAIATKAGMPLRLRRQQLITGDGYSRGERVSYWLTFTEVLAPHQGADMAAQPLPQNPR